MLVDALRPKLSKPFPNIPQYWECKIGDKVFTVPRYEQENMEWRGRLLKAAESNEDLQSALLTASKNSLKFWVNTFAWTYHQWEIDPETGEKYPSERPHRPFITWDIQDRLFDNFISSLLVLKDIKTGRIEKGVEDILIDKARNMGASWCCAAFNHWLWLFRSDSQILEMSRVEGYVDQTGNMKALFQKHDYINKWLPEWMLPPNCKPQQKNRTKMHMFNELNGSCIDGESTTRYAASGDRRLIILLDEFAKVEHGQAMRSATADAGLMRIINSTTIGPHTEYARWKHDGTIKVFVMPFWEHPEKGAGRHIEAKPDGGWEILSPWFEKYRATHSPKTTAREVLRQDLEAGDTFFSIPDIKRHMAEHVKPPLSEWSIELSPEVSKKKVSKVLQQRDIKAVVAVKKNKGPLKVWAPLKKYEDNGFVIYRPDQSRTYIFGIDTSTGRGASNSVVSIKCKQTGEKIAEWADANVPPYDFAYIIVALALWCGGANPFNIPFLKWEMNGPGWDLGKILVKEFYYPYYFKQDVLGKAASTKTQKYGWHSSRQTKSDLLGVYAKFLAHGGYINHSELALVEAMEYIRYDNGGIGPAALTQESSSAKGTHGDRCMADALTLDTKEMPNVKMPRPQYPKGSAGYRMRQTLKAKKAAKQPQTSWRKKYDFSGAMN